MVSVEMADVYGMGMRLLVAVFDGGLQMTS